MNIKKFSQFKIGKNKIRYDIHIDDDNVAFAVVILDAGDGKTWLSDLKVKKEFRGQGLVRELLEKIFNDYTGEIYIRAYAHYDEDGLGDDELIDMYKRFGFEQIDGKPKGYMIRK